MKYIYKYSKEDFVASSFPDIEQSPGDMPLAVGGRLDLHFLLDAYSHGIFPWFNANDPIFWWSPAPRFVLYPAKLHVGRTTRQVIKKEPFSFSLDRCFDEVIARCGQVPRPGQSGTWITSDIKNAYTRLHRIGLAHSVEVWQQNRLVGGLYGVSLGRAFFGESMFSLVSNASKLAMIFLVHRLQRLGFHFIDAQVESHYLKSLGAELIPREDFLAQLDQALSEDTVQGDWGELNGFFPLKGYPGIISKF